MSEATRKPHHVTVAEKLIGQLREGTAPWQKPWEPGTPGGMMPQNPVTGKRYNGINVLQLLSENRSDPRWVTFNQASSQGWRVRRGEKATPVQFWKFTEQVDKTDDQGKPVLNDKGQQEKETVKLDRPQVHWAFVFNAEQLDGIPPREVKEPVWNKLERAEAIFKASGAVVEHDQADSAFYRRSTDKIHMPPEGQFGSADKYYATKFHELGHWTGSDTRLNRDVGNNPFGSEEYAKEELRAEIASMIIGDELGLGHDPDQHAAYVKSWIKVLENDPMEIFRAAADAEKIQKFVLGFEQQQELVQSAYIQSPAPVGTPEKGLDLAPAEATNAPITPQEAEVAAALQVNRRYIADGEMDAAAVHQEESILPSLERAFGQVVHLPSNWTGNIQIRGTVIDANGEVEEATAGQTPKFFGVYAENGRGMHIWSADCPDLEKAENLAGRLRLIDTHSNREKSENIVAEKTPIKVPFKEKNEAKALGALWDGKAVTWYVPPGVDLNLFKKWTAPGEQKQAGQSQAEPPAVPASQAVPTPQQTVTATATAVAEQSAAAPGPVQTSKQFLAVPYGEREAAKSLGARWDKAAGSWYIGADADPEKLKRWTPDAIAEQKKMTPEEEFRDACESAGLVLRGKGDGQTLDGLPEMDGKRYRVPLVDDKPGDKNGVYIGHLDGHPAGFIQNHRTGVKQNWKSKGYSLTDDERANLNADAAIKMQARQQAQAAEYQEAATKVQKALSELSKPKATTVYLEAKGVQLHDGVLTDRGGKRTYIPAQDSTGKVWTMQYIREDGSKRFPKGSKKEGCFHVVGGMEALKAAPVLVIGEGYATMSTATEALGFASVAAFDSGNLKVVAASLKELFPDKPILFVGDDDVASAARSPSGINAGRMKAESAAKELGGQVIFPSFAPGELQSGLSDFNDLATRSELGRDAVTRQLKGAVKVTLDAKQQQQHEIAQEKTVEQAKAPKVAGFSR